MPGFLPVILLNARTGIFVYIIKKCTQPKGDIMKSNSKRNVIITAISGFFCLLSFPFIAVAQDSLSTNYIPDIATFLKIGSCGSPDFSRETGEIYFRSGMSGVNQLYRLTPEGWPYQLTLFDDGIDWYALSHKGDKAIIGASKGGSEQSQLYLMDAKTGRIEKITSNPDVQYGSIAWLKSGEGFFYRSNAETKKDFKIYFRNLRTGEDKKIFDMENSNWIFDLSLDDNYLIISHYSSNIDNDLYLLDLAANQSELLTPHQGDVLFSGATLLPDNKTVYVISNGNDEGIPKLAILDVSSKEIRFLDPESKWTVDAAAFSYDRRYMATVINQEGYSKLSYHDLETGSDLPVPSLEGIITSPAVMDDGRLLFTFTSSTQPPDVWIWNHAAKELKRLTYSILAGIDPALFVSPKLIKYKSFDGLEIPAFLFLPPSYNGKPVPFIIHAHGGPESQFQPYFQRNFQYLLLNGYGIIAPNIRGSSGYGKEYLNLDNYKNRLNSIKDIKAACDYLVENNYSRIGMIGIKGTSYGGYVVLATITEYPDLISAAVDEVGIANFVTFLRGTKDYRRYLRESEYGPLTDSAFLASISPIHKASLIKTPLLVVHGENDPRVPIGEARQIIKAIQNNGGIVDSLIFPDEGHGVSKQVNTIKLYKKIVDFFDRYLKK
jgi:dipeptidyl aminopeptidase/acylaminoacyl peptidase